MTRPTLRRARRSIARHAFAACAASLCMGAAVAQPAFVPVTDAMLANPDPADWLMWRRTFDSAGFSPLVQDFGAAGDLVLHELINGGADVCWLVDHYDELDIFAAGFMRHTATHCSPE